MAKKAPRRTAERILEVTLELFNRFGEPNVSTTLISAELNISPGNLYYHYPAKDELINSLFDRYERSLSELLNASDVERVIETAKAMPIPADQEILHILTQEFVIDGQDGIREPIGMSGMRLEVKTHIVTGAVSAAQNIVKCVRRCGLEVNDLVLQPLASSYAVLSEDEKDLGVCLIDIGGGTTDLAVWTQGAIRHTSVIPIAGDQITNDIAITSFARLNRPCCA